MLLDLQANLANDQRAVQDERRTMLEEIAAQCKREEAEIADLRETVLRDRAAIDDEKHTASCGR